KLMREIRIKAGEGIAGRVFREGKPLVVEACHPPVLRDQNRTWINLQSLLINKTNKYMKRY
ncbi:MAG: hypothetical protein AB1297_07750, partial [bacterium]